MGYTSQRSLPPHCQFAHTVVCTDMGLPLGIDVFLSKHPVENLAKTFHLVASQRHPDLSERVTRLVPFKSHPWIMP